MAHDVFISYAHEDKLTADAVCAKLEEKNVRCWIAPRDVRPGETWPTAVAKAIDGARVMVLVFSGHANLSRQIPNEVTRAVDNGLILVPLRIEDVLPAEDLSLFLTRPHWLDALTPPLEKHLEELCGAVASLLTGNDDEVIPEPQRHGEKQDHESGTARVNPPPAVTPSQADVTLSETQQQALAQWIRPGALFGEALTITGRMIMAPMRSSVATIPNVGVVLAVLGLVCVALYSWVVQPLVFLWLYVQSLLHKEELAQGRARRVTGTFALSVYRGSDSGIRGARLTLPLGTLYLSGQQTAQLRQAVDLNTGDQVNFAGTVVLVNSLGPNHLIALYDRSDHLLSGVA